MIIVTGVSGQLGSRIVDHLLERVPADTVGVSVRDVDRAPGLAERGVRVRAGDFTDPVTLAHAFEGPTRCWSCLRPSAGTARSWRTRPPSKPAGSAVHVCSVGAGDADREVVGDIWRQVDAHVSSGW